MRRFIIVLTTVLVSLLIAGTEVSAKEKKSTGKVIHKQKKNEKFDFEELSVEGETSNMPQDLSISPILQKNYRNDLPKRENFNPEIKNAIEIVN